MSGLDRVTGKSISGWELYASRFKNAITTQKGSRVKRRGYGSRYPELLGKMQNGINQALAQAYIVDAYYNESNSLRAGANLISVEVYKNHVGFKVNITLNYFGDLKVVTI